MPVAEFQAVVLAAGKGSRMPDLTAEKPRCLLPVGIKPLVYFPLRKLQDFGITDVMLVVSTDEKQQIKSVLDKTDLVIKIEYISKPNNDEGSAETLRKIADRITTNLLVMSCDLIADFKLQEMAKMFREKEASLLVLLFDGDHKPKTNVPGIKKIIPEYDCYSVSKIDDRLAYCKSAGDIGKMLQYPRGTLQRFPLCTVYTKKTDGHCYMMKKWVVKYLKSITDISTIKGEFLPHMCLKQLKIIQRPGVYTNGYVEGCKAEDDDVFRYIYDDRREKGISYNNYKDFLAAHRMKDMIKCFAHRARPDQFGIRVNSLPMYWTIHERIHQLLVKLLPNEENQYIDAKSDVKSSQVTKTFVWSGATIEEKTSLDKSIVGANSSIGTLSRIKNSVIMNNVVVSENVVIENCIICDHAVIREGSKLTGCLVGSKRFIRENSVHTNEVITGMDNMLEIE